MKDYLTAIAIFVNGVKDRADLQLSRDLGVQYKTALVLSHKIREAIAREQGETVFGAVAVDGAYFGGYVKPSNYEENRRDRRLAKNQNCKRKVVVVAREKGRKTVTKVFNSDAAGVPEVTSVIELGSTVSHRRSPHWDTLHDKFLTKRINRESVYSYEGACTNGAESFISRVRRAEIGIHHHIAGSHFAAYVAEMAWREDKPAGFE